MANFVRLHQSASEVWVNLDLVVCIEDGHDGNGCRLTFGSDLQIAVDESARLIMDSTLGVRAGARS